jgi:L-alanine-DL-glutamate epimerase-like enolase superfamily enzyme
VLEQLASIVVGAATTDVELLWETMYRATIPIGRRGVVLHAIAAIDIAIWDLLGKQLELPLHDLLGGRVRPAMPAYASWLYANEDLDALAAEARGWVDQGFRAVKQRLAYGPSDGPIGIRRNVELVRTVVDAVGPDVEVMADAYMGWDAGYAIRCIRAIEDAGLRLRWLEEPLVPDDVRGYARVRAAVDTPIAGGEHEGTRYGYRDLVAAEAVDVLQPDVNRMGGITEARRVWALGETWGLEVVAHIGAAHNLHLSISSHATPYVEYMPPPRPGEAADEDQLFWLLFPDEPRALDGTVTPTGRPGLGVTLDETMLQSTAAVTSTVVPVTKLA